jgi:hypothetical protein
MNGCTRSFELASESAYVCSVLIISSGAVVESSPTRIGPA